MQRSMGCNPQCGNGGGVVNATLSGLQPLLAESRFNVW